MEDEDDVFDELVFDKVGGKRRSWESSWSWRNCEEGEEEEEWVGGWENDYKEEEEEGW